MGNTTFHTNPNNDRSVSKIRALKCTANHTRQSYRAQVFQPQIAIREYCG